MQTLEYQERLLRDVKLSDRVKEGYSPAQATDELPRPRIIDGSLNPDGQIALGELFLCYENLAIKEGFRYNSKTRNKTSLSTDDLINQSYFGIYHAAITYNVDRGMSFTSHANQLIRNHLDNFTKQHESLVRLPSDVRDNVRRLGETVWSAHQFQERFPTRKRIAEAMDTSPNEVEELQIHEAKTVQMGSIDKGYYSDGRDGKSTLEAGEGKWSPVYPGAELYREAGVEAEALSKMAQEIIQQVLNEHESSGEVAKRGVQVVRLRFFGNSENDWQPMTHKEVSNSLGKLTGRSYSRERIRQIEVKTIAVLRSSKYRNILLTLFEQA